MINFTLSRVVSSTLLLDIGLRKHQAVTDVITHAYHRFLSDYFREKFITLL